MSDVTTRSDGAPATGRVPLLLIAPVVIFALVFVGARLVGHAIGGSSQDTNLFVDRPPFTWSETAVTGAAANASGEDQRILTRIAETPAAVWFTPEAYPIDKVGDAVSRVVDAASKVNQTPVLVVYGIPERDCSGGESSGGLPSDQYEKWVQEIADEAGPWAAVILEPDALATAKECGQVQQRTSLLRTAVTELADQGSSVYIDAGHANWIPPADMAAMLRDAGVEDARGFSTNVAGYESETDERVYADAVSTQLGGAHYVTDTGRNGVGSNGEWCNPSGRALGRTPGAVTGGASGALDAYLWIKPPGESDGSCGGGPGAGVFWETRALELARDAGW